MNGKRVVPVSALTALAVAASREEPSGTHHWRVDGCASTRRVQRVVPEDGSPGVRSRRSDRDRGWGRRRSGGDAAGDGRRAGAAPDVLVGDGAIVFAASVPAQISTLGQLPLAGVIGQIAMARALRGRDGRSCGVQPLYIRRPDAEIARDARPSLASCKRPSEPESLAKVQGLKSQRMSIVVEPVTSAEDLGGLLAVEQASFLNPWTRDMYVAELRNPEVSYLLVAKDSAGRVVGFCGFWRVVDELHINNLAVLPEYRRQGIASTDSRPCVRRGASGRRRSRHARGEPIERDRPALVRTLWLYRGRRPARLLPATRTRMRWCSGAKDFRSRSENGS